MDGRILPEIQQEMALINIVLMFYRVGQMDQRVSRTLKEIGHVDTEPLILNLYFGQHLNVKMILKKFITDGSAMEAPTRDEGLCLKGTEYLYDAFKTDTFLN